VVARPDDVCPEERPADTESSGVVDTASRPATASVASVHRRCPPIRCRRPGSGCPALWCPVTWGRRPERPALGRLLSTVQRPAVWCPAVWCPAVWCPAVRCPAVRWLPPVGPDASVSSHAQAVAVGTGSSWPGDRDHRNRGGPWGWPGRRRLERRSRRRGRDRRGRSRGVQWEVGGGPGPPGWVRASAAALDPERPVRPGRRGERPSRAAARWARVQR
jgi:hypothetical protein